MKVVVDTHGAILGRWRGEVTHFNGFELDPPQIRVEIVGVSMFADESERFTHKNATEVTVEERPVFECDFCNELRDNSTLLKIASIRPSDPHSACSVMWGCTVCGNGKTDARLEIEFDAQGIDWEG